MRHSNESDDGKAGRQKADDIFTAIGCQPCENYVSNLIVKEDPLWLKKWYLDRGIKRSIRRLFDKGVYKVA